MTSNMDYSRLATPSMFTTIEDVVTDPTPPPPPHSVDLDPLTYSQPSSQGQSLSTQDNNDVLGDLLEILHGMVGDLSPPTSPPPPSPPSHPGSVQSVGLKPLTVVQSGPLCSQAALGRPGQDNSYYTAQQIQSLPFWGYLPDGQMVHILPAPTASLTAPTSLKIKRRTRVKLPGAGPYVKKPPNAFMLFMREQRPNYAGQVNNSGSAGINRILGQKWKSLSHEEQAAYYEQADGEKRLHAQRHPEWTSGNNYGVKRKRDRSPDTKLSVRLANASTSGEAPPPARTLFTRLISRMS